MADRTSEAASVTQEQPSPRTSAWAETFGALRYRDFRLLWTATLFVAGGVWLQQVTLGWLAYEMTGSPLQVGLIMGTRSAPMLFAPITGVLADRMDRRKLLLVDQLLVSALVLAFAVDLLLGQERVWHLYVFAAIFGVLWTINNPVRQTLVADSVPRERLMNAMALNSMGFNTMRAIGPAIGGFLIQAFGAGVNFLMQGIGFLFIFGLMFMFRSTYGLKDRSKALSESPFRNLVEGFKYLLSNRVALTATLVTFVLMMTVAAMAFNQLPVYAAEALNRDSTGLGLLFMSLGIGGFFGTVLMARFSNVRRKGLQSLVAFSGAAVTLVIVSQVTVLWLAMLVLGIQQLFLQIVLTTDLNIVQAAAPDEIRGRVTGVYQMEVGMMLIGGIAAGAIASRWGVGTAFLTGGLLAIVALVLIVLLAPQFRRLRL